MIIVVMGVSGAGKSTVGRALAERLGYGFAEGDDYHPPANIAKMSAGIPLEDADRLPWLQCLSEQADLWIGQRRNMVLACSALKRRYRGLLARPGLRFVYLQGPPTLIAQRLRRRRDHYMPPSLLRSQFRALEEPAPEENAVTVGVHLSQAELVAAICESLRRDSLFDAAQTGLTPS